MIFRHFIENNMLVLHIEGNITQSSLNDLKTYLKPFLEDNAIQGVILNLEKVNLIDSSGIGLILTFHKQLCQRQAYLRLCHLSQKNREALRLTQLDRIFSIYPTVEEALQRVKVR